MKNRKYLLPVAVTGAIALTFTACSPGGGGGSEATGGDCSAYESYGKHDGKTVSIYASIVDVEGTRVRHVANGVCLSEGADLAARLCSLHAVLRASRVDSARSAVSPGQYRSASHCSC